MPGLNPTQQDIDQFVAITQASHEDAEHFLTTGTTLQGAIEDFYAAQNATELPTQDQDEDEDHEMSNPEDTTPPNPSGPRTLGGQAADTALPAGWGQKKKTVGRVGDWGDSGSGSSGPKMGGFGGGGDDEDDDDDDEDEQKRGQEFYTGGEKSGLAVQNPDGPKKKGHKGLVSDILKQAAEGGKGRQAKEAAGGSSSAFRGSGNTLGSEDDPAPEPSTGGPSVAPVSSSAFDSMLGSIFGGRQMPPPPEEEPEPQTRHLTFWQDGFSIEDGPLYRYDDPKNKDLLEAIKSGQAPRSIFDVEYNQPLEIVVAQRTKEPYRAPPKVTKPFEGGGNRLGSAAPEVSGSGSGSSAAGPSGSSGAGQTAEPTSFEVDASKPTTSIQLRLGDGTKIVAKVNLTHTIGDLRSYVAAARPDSRPFALQTTFPNKELSDFSETIESAKLQNAVVVQRFT